MMRAILTAILLATIAFSGCTTDEASTNDLDDADEQAPTVDAGPDDRQPITLDVDWTLAGPGDAVTVNLTGGAWVLEGTLQPAGPGPYSARGDEPEGMHILVQMADIEWDLEPPGNLHGAQIINTGPLHEFKPRNTDHAGDVTVTPMGRAHNIAATLVFTPV